MIDDDTIDHQIDEVRDTGRLSNCPTCRNEALARAVVRWIDRRRMGEVLPSLSTMTTQLFTRLGKTSESALRRHISRCLGRDHRTGRAQS